LSNLHKIGKYGKEIGDEISGKLSTKLGKIGTSTQSVYILRLPRNIMFLVTKCWLVERIYILIQR